MQHLKKYFCNFELEWKLLIKNVRMLYSVLKISCLSLSIVMLYVSETSSPQELQINDLKLKLKIFLSTRFIFCKSLDCGFDGNLIK